MIAPTSELRSRNWSMTPSPQAIEWSAHIRRSRGVHRRSSLAETKLGQLVDAQEGRLMEWSGRAPAPPAREAGKGRQSQGARHVSETQRSDRSDRHRYRQELVPHRGS